MVYRGPYNRSISYFIYSNRVMILAWLIIILMLAGFISWVAAQWNNKLCRWVALLATTIDLCLVVWIGIQQNIMMSSAGSSQWLIQLNRSWIPSLGIGFHLAMVGLSWLILLLTNFLGVLSVLCSWNEIKERTGFFYFNLL